MAEQNNTPYVFLDPALEGTRINDLVAKVAKVALRDTTRVLQALDLICELTGDDADYIITSLLSYDKPTPEEARKCAASFDILKARLGPDAISKIRNMED